MLTSTNTENDKMKGDNATEINMNDTHAVKYNKWPGHF